MINSHLKQKTYLLLLEDVEAYESYEELRRDFEFHKTIVCCLSNSAVNFCKKNSIDYKYPEEYFSDEESNFFQKISEDKIRKLVKDLNIYYQRAIGPVDGFSFDMGNYHYFMLYHYFGALHYRAFILSKVIEGSKPDGIIVAKYPAPTGQRLFPVTQYRNCYHDLCLESKYRNKVIPIALSSVGCLDELSVLKKIRNFILKNIRKTTLVNNFINLKINKINFSMWWLMFKGSKKSILLLGGAGPWKPVFIKEEFKNRIEIINDDDHVHVPKEAMEDWFFKWFRWEDNFCGFYISKLSFYEMSRIKILSEKIIAHHKDALSMIKLKCAVAYPVAPYAGQQYLLSVAKYVGIPRICLQHGEMGLQSNPGLWNEASELLYVSHYFSFGDGVSQNKIQQIGGLQANIRAISIGSPALDNFKNIPINNKGKYILYASSKYHNYCAFIRRYTDKRVSENQQLIIQYFEKQLQENSNLSVIWKQNTELTVEQPIIKAKKVLIIKNEKSFVQLLPDASIIILDRPSTTSLEACMTNKPIFALLSREDWHPEAYELFVKRAVVSLTAEGLLKAIDLYLSQGIYEADTANDEFVMHYGCVSRKINSSERALNELLGGLVA